MMKARELLNMGFKEGPIIGLLLKASCSAKARGMSANQIRTTCQDIRFNPRHHTSDIVFGKAASHLVDMQNPTTYDMEPKEYKVWGEHLLDEGTHEQMKRAMELPISVAGMICPDGHLGFGIPIGGVLATDNAVLPYAVGMDISCSMMVTVLPIEYKTDEKDPIDIYREDFKKAINNNTRFGVGSEFDSSDKRQHEVMDTDWNISPIVKQVKDKAARQLGTSGSSNHFCDICEIEFPVSFYGVPVGKYIAIMTHSGSRGPGAQIASYYTKLAISHHPKIPKEYKYLSWLEFGQEGDAEEYWAAMQLMCTYAQACHECIHETMLKELKMQPIFQMKNSHNFARREIHFGKDLIVHRKGATPSGIGVLGVIPGSMGDYAYLVEGKGNPDSLNSSSHGAGRAMSRKKARESFCMSHELAILKKKGIELMSGGVDEVSGSYKKIAEVMAAQTDLVDIRATLFPRIVKMGDE